jgi:hypothetical protein
VSDTLRALFSSELFLPRGHCYLWKPSLVGLHVLANALLGFAFVAVAVAVVRAARHKRELPLRIVGALLLVAGLTHLSDVWVIWRPLYWLDGVLRAAAAALVLAAAITLPWRARPRP